MENNGPRMGSFVVGGIFLGVWLYVAIFGVPFLSPVNVLRWNFWAFIGLALAGGFWASRITPDHVRIVIWVAMGIAIAFLLMAALFDQAGEAIAAVITFAGAGLIVTGLPAGIGQRPHWHQVEDQSTQ